MRTHTVKTQKNLLGRLVTGRGSPNDKSKKYKFRHPESQKNVNFTIDLLSLDIQYVLWDSKLDEPTPNVAGSSNIHSIPGSDIGTES